MEDNLIIPNWDKINVDVYDKIYDEAKIRFAEVVSESETITKRAISVFTLLIVTSAFFIPFFKPSPIDFAISIVIILAFIISILLMMPKKMIEKGTSPETILTKDLTNEEKPKMQRRIFYCLQLQTYYTRINKITGYNQPRLGKVKFLGYLLIGLIVLFALKFNINDRGTSARGYKTTTSSASGTGEAEYQKHLIGG